MTDGPSPHLQPILANLRKRDFTGALAAAEIVLAGDPDDAAAAGLAALCALQLGDPDRAVPLLLRQVGHAPGDMAARFNLASTLAGLDRKDEALVIAAEYGESPKLARLAGFLWQDAGQPEAAIAPYCRALSALPDDWESWNNLGNCYSATGRTDDAVAAFENAINRATGKGRPELFLNLSQSLTGVENRSKRLHAATEGHRRFPDDNTVLIELGLAQAASGDTLKAEATLRLAASAEATFGEAYLELGLLYENANRLADLDALIAECEALASAPELAFLRAWSLRRQDRFAEAETVAAQIPATISPIRTAQLRGEIADRLGHYDEAFKQFAIMNGAAALAHPPPAGPSYRETIVAQTAAMTASPALPSRVSAPFAPADPVFIVGSPRSGTTLLDTLLGALPEVQVFEELPMLARVENAFPTIATCTDPALLDAARARYFELAAELDGSTAGRRIIDKMPLHLTHMPVINRLFPDAAIVLVERHPCDAVLSCFMANFTLNHGMRSYTTLGEAARTYDAVFANWTRANELYPLQVHRVRYERMIADLEAEMRPLVEFLNLPWRDEVLDNQASAARRGLVRTASYSQVGQPLYQRAVGRWERYRPMVDPTLPILQPWIEAMGY